MDAAKSASSNKGKAASTPAEYKQNQCAAMGIGMGPRIHEVCPFSAVNHSYASTGSSALEAAIATAYKQVFGNIGISDSQRLTSLEAFLCDGRINVQGFMGGLVKSDLYKQKFFHAVSPMRGIELTTKHLLGRPPVSQQEISAGIQLIADQGFDAFVDSLTHSEEYLETFGTDTVPYLRGFKSEARAACSTFVGMADITPANASSEHAMYTGPSAGEASHHGPQRSFAAGCGASRRQRSCVASPTPMPSSNPRNAAYRRMYGGKFNYGRYLIHCCLQRSRSVNGRRGNPPAFLCELHLPGLREYLCSLQMILVL